MKTLYMDASAGIAGNMAVGMLLDMGGDQELLRNVIESVPFETSQPEIIIKNDSKKGFAATYFNTVEDHNSHENESDHDELSDQGVHHTTYDYIKNLIEKSSASEPAKSRAIGIFKALFTAEAAVHGSTFQDVHLHEAGGVDAICDILGFSVLSSALEIDSFHISSINTGSGQIKCAHGILPVPAPATAQLLRGFPVFAHSDIPGEFTTPTGAAILKGINAIPGMPSDFTFHKIGSGSGYLNPTFPNILRGFLGSTKADKKSAPGDFVTVLETRIDDATGEIMAHAMDSLVKQGALDVWMTPHTGRKGRPGIEFTVLCKPEDCDRIEHIIFRELPTLGIRKHTSSRSVLPRKNSSISFKDIQLETKASILADGKSRVKIEFESLKTQAEKMGLTPLELMDLLKREETL